MLNHQDSRSQQVCAPCDLGGFVLFQLCPGSLRAPRGRVAAVGDGSTQIVVGLILPLASGLV
jgi:hypothetical protein